VQETGLGVVEHGQEDVGEADHKGHYAQDNP
jgi:hypothetical protein